MENQKTDDNFRRAVIDTARRVTFNGKFVGVVSNVDGKYCAFLSPDGDKITDVNVFYLYSAAKLWVQMKSIDHTVEVPVVA